MKFDMIVTSFLRLKCNRTQVFMEYVLHNRRMQKNGAACRKTSQGVKLKIHCSIYLFCSHGITLPPIRHENYALRKDKFVVSTCCATLFECLRQIHLSLR